MVHRLAEGECQDRSSADVGSHLGFSAQNRPRALALHREGAPKGLSHGSWSAVAACAMMDAAAVQALVAQVVAQVLAQTTGATGEDQENGAFVHKFYERLE